MKLSPGESWYKFVKRHPSDTGWHAEARVVNEGNRGPAIYRFSKLDAEQRWHMDAGVNAAGRDDFVYGFGGGKVGMPVNMEKTLEYMRCMATPPTCERCGEEGSELCIDCQVDLNEDEAHRQLCCWRIEDE